MQDHYPEAAVRHYRDGVILRQKGRYDNAMCHYAFSAECAIKSFWLWFRQVYGGKPLKSHDAASVLNNMMQYHELLGVLDPQMSLLIGTEAPPPVLFQQHPERRYGNDICYTDAELAACEAFADRFVQRVIAAALDGRLTYESVRGAL